MSSPLTPSTRRFASLPQSTSRTTSALAEPPPPPTTPPIPDVKKNQIKALIVSSMLKVPRRIRPQLSEASPSSVPMTSPCPSPPSSLSLSPTSAPPPTIPSSTAFSGLPTPSCSSSTTPPTPPPSALTSSTASTASPPPLPDVFVKAAQFISANATTSSLDVLCPFFECQHLSCRIFHSLNSTDLPEFFDDPMREWMT